MGDTFPGAKVGDQTRFAGLFGASPVLEVRNIGASLQFVHFGRRISVPLQSLGSEPGNNRLAQPDMFPGTCVELRTSPLQRARLWTLTLKHCKPGVNLNLLLSYIHTVSAVRTANPYRYVERIQILW